MTTQLQLRKRIRTAQNVEQITKAMEAVATAQLRGATRHVEQSSRYSEQLEKMLSRLAGSTENFSHPFLVQREIKKAGLVIITGDKGLSGPYNDNILAEADAFLKNPPASDVELFLIGRKAISHYAKKAWKVCYSLDHWSGKLTPQMVVKTTKAITDAFLQNGVDAIWIIYTRYQGILNRKVVNETFLPIKPEKAQSPMNYILEPGPQGVLEALLPRYCEGKIQRAFDEAYASELASRAFSMRKATNNARDMLDQLVLVSNKLRQAGITREMIEIAAGIEGVS